MEFVVPGTPFGKQRPKAGRRGKRTVIYTPDETKVEEERVRGVWRATGFPRLDDGPVEIALELVMKRPGDHFRVNGELSAKGLREPYPLKKPDVDNVLKLITDALNGLAYRDDAQIMSVRRLFRRWAAEGEGEHVWVDVRRYQPRIRPMVL